MSRELEPSIISLLGEHRSMTAEEIAEALESDAELVNATLQQMKDSQWVIDIGEGRWRTTKPRLGN